MIICAGNNEEFSFAKSIGVGLIQSAITLTRVCMINKPNYLLFIGSAGSYGKYNIFDIIQSRSASNIELSFFSNDSYTPLDNMLLSNNNKIDNETIVNSSNYISTNMSISSNFIKYGVGIENMEFYSLLKVAQEFDIEIGGIFIITNFTNKDAHKDFKTNHKEAMTRLERYLSIKNIIVSHETSSC